MISLLGMSLVSAQWEGTPKVEANAPSLWEKILNFFKTDDFTIVGQARNCDVEPFYRGAGQVSYFDRGFFLGYWSFSPGTVGDSSLQASAYCDSGHGFFDVYCQTNPFAQPGDVGFPRFEMEDWVYFTCTDSCAKCNVELYCCPDGGCEVDNDCSYGEECTTEYRDDPYMQLRDPQTGQEINQFSYCTEEEGCTGPDIHCWRIGASNTCEENIYNCDYATYPNCPSSWQYNSLAQCQANICYPETCTSLGKECGNWADGCGGYDLACGNCDSGYFCLEGQCVEEGSLLLNVQEAITIKQLKSFTSADLAKSMCTSTDQCKEGTCLSLQYLEDNGDITSARTEAFFDDTSQIVFTSTGAVIGIGACTVLAGAVGLSTFGAGFALFPICALVGGYGGMAADNAFNGIMDAFADENKNAAGFCIKEGGDLDSIFGWAAFYDLDGDGDKDGLDGMIIAVGGFLILIIISKNMIFGRFKYVYEK